jgi:hypothetical protein
MSTLATLIATLLPHERVILGACVAIFGGFVMAAVIDVLNL